MTKNTKTITILVAIIALIGAGAAFMSTKFGKNDETKTETAKTEDGKDTPKQEEVIVAKVNGQDVTRNEVIKFITALPPQMQQMPIEQLFPMALEQVVSAKIVDEKAKTMSGLASDSEVEKRLDEAKVQIMRAVYVEKEIEKLINDERLQAAYEEAKVKQKPTEEIKASHILVDSESKAKEIIEKLKGGADFAALAKEFSKDTSNKDQGGELGYFTKDTMVKSFADAAFAMKAGDLSSSPVKTQFGFHVIKVEDKRVAPFPSFEQVREQLAVGERRKILDELVKSWNESATIERFDINGKPLPKSEPNAETAPAEAAPKAE
jgi:peptidyl-prolyl cis-trans isomerase C